jgi:folate-dependent phosphoribosylglycinamide formyltransferase PurN
VINQRYKVCIFAYSFKHKKTNDLINLVSRVKCLDIVIAAPKKKLKIKSSWIPKNKNKKIVKLYQTRDLCIKRNINYTLSSHDNFLKIKKIVKKYRINLGIISGARIIDKRIIKLFKFGIINFHPGKIPETSGLDALYWTIKKKIHPYVTAHFIDKYVDKGKIIFQSKIKVLIQDDYHSLSNRIYKGQLDLLKKILVIIKNNHNFSTKFVYKYLKNDQLNTNQKKNIYKEYYNWKKNLIK